jgi:heme oxygenase
MKTTSELRKLFAVFFDERDIVEVILFSSDASVEESAQALVLACQEASALALARGHDAVHIIIDLAALGNSSPAEELWRAIADFSQSKETLKVAVVGGGSSLGQTWQNWQAKATDNINWFGDRAGALRWLK